MSLPNPIPLPAAQSSPATRFLGTEVLALNVEKGSARFRFQGRPEFLNMLGHVQGGFVAAMLDEAAGLTARLVSPIGLVVPSLNFHVTFIWPVPSGPVLANGRCLRVGGRVAFLEAELIDHDEQLLSLIQVTSLAVRKT